MAAQGREAYARMAKLTHLLPSGGGPLVEDLVDQFERVRGLCDGEQEFLHGALDIYQSRTETKMNYAMERLAVPAVVTLPITALASVYGTNVIVNSRTDFPHVAVVLLGMAAMSPRCCGGRSGRAGGSRAVGRRGCRTEGMEIRRGGRPGGAGRCRSPARAPLGGGVAP